MITVRRGPLRRAMLLAAGPFWDDHRRDKTRLMDIGKGLQSAVRDVVDGFRLTPLWWRVGIEQTVTRYRRTLLGPFWVASSTLSAAFAIAVVFGAIFGSDMRSNLPYIITGIVVWGITGGMLADGSGVFFSASGLMQAQRLPLSFHVLLQIDKLYINFAHQLIALWAVLTITKLIAVPNWEILLSLPLVAATAFALYIPIGMLAIRYRDINYMIQFVAQALFMLSPVFWHRSQIPARMSWIITFNPFAHLLEIVRQPLLGKPAMISDWIACIVFFLSCALVALVSLVLYRRRVIFWL